MSRLAKLAVISVCFVLMTCGPVDSEPPIAPWRPAINPAAWPIHSGAARRTAGLSLRLSASGEQRRDRIVVNATVTNISGSPVSWDREFSVHVGWRVADEKGTAIAQESLESCAKPAPRESQNRFMILMPGQSFSTNIDLAGRFRASFEAHASGIMRAPAQGCVSWGIFREEFAQYHIPETCKRIVIKCGYNVDSRAFGAIVDWFGGGTGGLRFWDGPVDSAALTISLE
jgi:hypothetical protein